jgi:transposase
VEEAIMGRKGIEVVVSELEREQLLSMSRSRSLPHSLVRRAKIVLMAADGRTSQEMATQCEVTPPAITHWKKRFVARGLAGLHDEARPGRPRTHDDEAVAELLARILHEKPDGATSLERALRCCADRDVEEFGGPISVVVRCTAPSFKKLQAV